VCPRIRAGLSRGRGNISVCVLNGGSSSSSSNSSNNSSSSPADVINASPSKPPDPHKHAQCPTPAAQRFAYSAARVFLLSPFLSSSFACRFFSLLPEIYVCLRILTHTIAKISLKNRLNRTRCTYVGCTLNYFFDSARRD
jgi:hypothetical protein